MVAWTLITSLVYEGCTTYANGGNVITQLNFPYSILNYVAIWRNIIVFFHNVLIVVVINLVLSISSAPYPPGDCGPADRGRQRRLDDACCSGSSARAIATSRRFVANVMQVMMFITPVFWNLAQLPATGAGLSEAELYSAPDRGDARTDARPGARAVELRRYDRRRDRRLDRCIRLLRALSPPHSLLALRGSRAGSNLVDNVTVDFPIYGANQQSLRHTLLARTGGLIRREGQRHQRVIIRALDGVCLELKEGDRFAWSATTGRASPRCCACWPASTSPTPARCGSTARFRRCSMRRRAWTWRTAATRTSRPAACTSACRAEEVDQKLPDIAEFCELGEYLDLPIRTYSSGMLTRLCFAIATAIDPDILLLDEGIAAGRCPLCLARRDPHAGADRAHAHPRAGEPLRRPC